MKPNLAKTSDVFRKGGNLSYRLESSNIAQQNSAAMKFAVNDTNMIPFCKANATELTIHARTRLQNGILNTIQYINLSSKQREEDEINMAKAIR
jgi:hypothetical protein